ncbi:hypothetical protein JQ554_02890 [Bradyrhizobium diazoefficiens]|nr:hypothetical protein [Bradyrhizobium diazoefficiens]MBR0963016.1 hypothetical protein [Bradyrhizobium diazoefficiens]MBR0977176.1 hypothetical protein [Bradyrhizobium diazoefficiens]MBR1005821.1 hypothetical protein [Bradyrhizobium diazoefficiens]MBR1012294.1 hypothetical protein [Bradyrhizobium diazoefficiens]MBR1049635.1 hypothetical protein [Bradyrhizobium diazoefficiens]
MGEAKQKLRTLRALLTGTPACIYCAGARPATTIEHMPPIQIFEGRQRPRGLEFPACDVCNSQTGHADLVASLLARCFPAADTSVQRRDFLKILSAVSNNIPALLTEMHIPRAAGKLARKSHGLPESMHPLRANGPLLNRYILTFAAKLGFALHFETMSEVVPAAGGVQVMWFSNLQAMKDDIPQELFDLLPGPKSLQQGRKGVGDQFKYSIATGEKGHTLYFASFNFSFAVAGITAVDRSIWLEGYADRFPIYVPGEFNS